MINQHLKPYKDAEYIEFYDIDRDVMFYVLMWKERLSYFVFDASLYGKECERAKDLLFQRCYVYLTSEYWPHAPFPADKREDGSYRTGIWSKENTDFLKGIHP